MKSLIALAVLAATLQVASAADLTGKVTLKGTPPPETKIALDAACGKIQPNPISTRHYVTDGKGGLGNVFVYVKNIDKKHDAPATGPLLDQVGCEYVPYVIGAQAGQKITIKNSDALMHNVHAIPKPGTGNKEFNFAQPLQGQKNEKVFDNPEVMVKFKCDVHPWMFAYVGVLNHPYFAVSDKDGSFKIAGLPDGKYTVVAYHLKAHGPNGTGESKEIEVKGNATIDFTVEVPAAK